MKITRAIVETAAKRKFACADATAFPYQISVGHGQPREEWVGLAVLRNGEWEHVARRKTYDELLEAVEKR